MPTPSEPKKLPPKRIDIFRHYADAPPDVPDADKGRYYYDDQIDNRSDWSKGVVAFSAYDPNEPAPPNTIPIWRLYPNPNDRDALRGVYRYHLSTIGQPAAGWIDPQKVCYAYREQPQGRNDLVEIWEEEYVDKGNRYYYYYGLKKEMWGKPGEGGVKGARCVFWAYPPPDLRIIDEAYRILEQKPDKNRDVTYLRSTAKFTRLDTPGIWGQGPTATGRGSPRLQQVACFNY